MLQNQVSPLVEIAVRLRKLRGSPPEQQEGWMRDQEKVAKPPQLAQTGWCGPGIFLTTPPRPSATPPPAEEGTLTRRSEHLTLAPSP